MIGFNALGRMGRLANQMFQYASLKGIAKNVGADIIVPYYKDAIDDGIGNKLRSELFDSFNLNVNTGLLNNGNAPVVQERFFHFDEDLFKLCPDHVSLHGFFQSEKYFKHIEDEIRADFSFKDEILEPCKEMIGSVGEAVSLHVRRTDYLQNPNHTALDLDYYEEALNKFYDTSSVLVFSDDLKWCKEQELFSGDRFMISESGDQYVDLCLMSLCKQHIIANSSYSWWGAWLSGSDDVISPVKWFGKDNQDKDTKDLIPERWVRI